MQYAYRARDGERRSRNQPGCRGCGCKTENDSWVVAGDKVRRFARLRCMRQWSWWCWMSSLSAGRRAEWWRRPSVGVAAACVVDRRRTARRGVRLVEDRRLSEHNHHDNVPTSPWRCSTPASASCGSVQSMVPGQRAVHRRTSEHRSLCVTGWCAATRRAPVPDVVPAAARSADVTARQVRQRVVCTASQLCWPVVVAVVSKSRGRQVRRQCALHRPSSVSGSPAQPVPRQTSQRQARSSSVRRGTVRLRVWSTACRLQSRWRHGVPTRRRHSRRSTGNYKKKRQNAFLWEQITLRILLSWILDV